MPVLLGLETAAVAAVAYKWTPRARETGTRLYNYLTSTGRSSQQIVVRPVDAPRKEDARMPAILPELRAVSGAADRSPLRDKEILELIERAVPRTLSGAVGGVWHLLFTTDVDGTSLAHMLRTVSSDASLLLVVRSGGRVFGVFCPELRDPQHWSHAASASGTSSGSSSSSCGSCGSCGSSGTLGGIGMNGGLGATLAAHAGLSSSCAGGTTSTGGLSSHGFYGSGEGFLFALSELCLPPPPEDQLSSPSPGGGRAEAGPSVVLYTYRWSSGRNTHFVRSDETGLFFGSGGRGGVGLALHAPLTSGRSGECETYLDSMPLPEVATPLTSVCRADAAARSADAVATASPSEGAPPKTPPSGRGGDGVPLAGMRRERSATSIGEGMAVSFDIDALEVWALDQRACRAMEACRAHERVAPHR